MMVQKKFTAPLGIEPYPSTLYLGNQQGELLQERKINKSFSCTDATL
jgi:hypothetical protein